MIQGGFCSRCVPAEIERSTGRLFEQPRHEPRSYRHRHFMLPAKKHRGVVLDEPLRDACVHRG
jgi:hypothetical protein